MEIPANNSTPQRNPDSEAFGNSPKASETFRKFEAPRERKATHTVSVRDAAKMFEAAGVARTERSIINWCWPNRQGLARLDCYFDPNDRKYYITQESIELAIKEELSKGEQKSSGAVRKGEATVPNDSESPPASSEDRDALTKQVTELQKEVLDLKITNRGKDFLIDQLREERSAFGQEREKYVNQLIAANREVGELTTRLMQIEGPRGGTSTDSEPVSDHTPPVG